MKKFLKGFITITMVFIFAIALTGCGNKETQNNEVTNKCNNNQEQEIDLS